MQNRSVKSDVESDRGARVIEDQMLLLSSRIPYQVDSMDEIMQELAAESDPDPDSRVLLVDDNYFNLYAAQSLLT